MRSLAVCAAAFIAAAGLNGCSSADAADIGAGDCLHIGGTADAPEAAKVACGGPESSFKVASVVDNPDKCPMDVDSSYTLRSGFSQGGDTVCMDVDWVVDGCMSIDPQNNKDPVRVDCNDRSVPNRQRATQILQDVANTDQCTSGVGYAYDERQFTVCVEDVG